MRIWFFDFDGTLAPIVADRNAAVMDTECARVLRDLSQSPSDWVAIISSRSLDDIIPRIPFDDVIIGGNSGLQWQLPSGCRLSPVAGKEDELQYRRDKLMPWLEIIGRKPGIEIEDKLWSVAIHIKKPGAAASEKVTKSILAWAERENVTLHKGPNVLEIQMMDGFNKSGGASFLARTLNINPEQDSIIYAGDDGNDAVAMWWAQMTGGTAIMVGSQLNVPGAIYVQDQQALADTVQELHNDFTADKRM